jgi:hypothetical protein
MRCVVADGAAASESECRSGGESQVIKGSVVSSLLSLSDHLSFSIFHFSFLISHCFQSANCSPSLESDSMIATK